MPYKTKELQREYQRLWMARRRQEWLEENGPCVRCGSWDNLNVDHIDRKTKIDHKVWSWAEVRRLKELNKCQVLCFTCHVEKTWTEDFIRAQCGSGSKYNNGCRCAECRKAHTLKRREYRLRTGKR